MDSTFSGVEPVGEVGLGSGQGKVARDLFPQAVAASEGSPLVLSQWDLPMDGHDRQHPVFIHTWKHLLGNGAQSTSQAGAKKHAKLFASIYHPPKCYGSCLWGLRL